MDRAAGGISCFLQWYIVLPVVLAHIVTPAVVFSFFCRFCRAFCPRRVKLIWCVCYVALSAGVSAAEYKIGLKGSPGLVLETALLACCGKIPGKKRWVETFALSMVILSVFSVSNGIISWTEKRIFVPVIFAHQSLIRSGDGIRELLKVLGGAALLGAVYGRFGGGTEERDERTLVWMAVPVFFIAMVERIIQNSVYGDSLVIDSASGKIGSVIDINHGEMLFLQIFSCFCLFLVLLAYEKITGIFRETEGLKLLKQQARAQEIYVQEASMRYEQTRAFRHDIKNHLAILEKLLRDGKGEEARKYLSQLEETAKGISDGIFTGNAAVDALLGSKLDLARREGITVEWDIRIPDESGIRDMDWCIILANGADNAIEACRDVEAGQRYLRIEGRRKGNFYLISMENSCRDDMKETPKAGIGLGSIRNTAEKYGGRMENQVSAGKYRLRVLLVDSQQERRL